MSDLSSETGTGRHLVRLEQFEGPLDLLLFLIRRSEINIYDIPIHEITEQYVQALEYATRIDLENITEFYGLAATLLLIKSRMLLPTQYDDDEDYEDPRQELVDRLIEYQKFRRLTQLMSDQEESVWVLEPRRKQRSFDFVEDDDLWEQLDVWDLFQTFSTVMSRLTPERIIDLYEEVSINEKLSLIYELLEERSEFLFEDLIVKPDSIMDVVCAFLAVLEAVKALQIGIYQNRLFGDIRIRKRVTAQNSGEPAGGQLP